MKAAAPMAASLTVGELAALLKTGGAKKVIRDWVSVFRHPKFGIPVFGHQQKNAISPRKGPVNRKRGRRSLISFVKKLIPRVLCPLSIIFLSFFFFCEYPIIRKGFSRN